MVEEISFVFLNNICYHGGVMKKLIFEFYTRPNGHNEFVEFYKSLPQKDREKLLATISMIQEHGLLTAQRMEWVKKLNSDIFEIRSKVSSNIQRALYFHAVDNRYIITHGFTKKLKKHPLMKLKRHKSSKKNLKGNRKMKTIKFNDFLNEQLSDNSFNEGYQAEKAILESALAVANARSKAGLTQRQLSELSHVPQSTIARIERGHNTSIETMSKLAVALKQELKISIG